MKLKTLTIFLFYKNSYASSNSASSVIKDWLLNSLYGKENVITDTTYWKDSLFNLFLYVKNIIFDILWIIVVWVFLYIWYKILASRWNPEEFKKAFKMFIYTIIGLVIISLAWVLVIFISGLKI